MNGEPRMPELEQPHGYVCQSCGMPLITPDQFGTSASGSRVTDYCSYCYRDGHFTDPNMTKTQMIARVASLLVSKRAIPEYAAESLANRIVPTLKRWTNGIGM